MNTRTLTLPVVQTGGEPVDAAPDSLLEIFNKKANHQGLRILPETLTFTYVGSNEGWTNYEATIETVEA